MYLYILFNKEADKYYIGISEDPNRRLKEHNSAQSRFTGRVKGDWILVYLKLYNSKSEARKEEIRLKKAKNKKYIRWYIDHK